MGQFTSIEQFDSDALSSWKLASSLFVFLLTFGLVAWMTQGLILIDNSSA